MKLKKMLDLIQIDFWYAIERNKIHEKLEKTKEATLFNAELVELQHKRFALLEKLFSESVDSGIED